MRTALKWAIRLVAVLLIIVGLVLAMIYYQTNQRMNKLYTVRLPPVAVSADPAAVERGRYLVERVAMCSGCHAKDLGGRVMVDDFTMGRLAAANLTRGHGGIGARYTDEDFVRALVHGVKKDGRSVIFMPSQDFRFTQADLGAVVSYLRTIPPVDRDMPSPAMGPMARTLTFFNQLALFPAELIDHDKVAFAQAPTEGDQVARGRYLVDSAGCRGCHTPELTGGGGPPPGAANITPTGIGDWTEQDFVRALREHKRPNGVPIDEAMPVAFGQMSDEDLHLIFTYLKTVPAKGQKTKNQLKS